MNNSSTSRPPSEITTASAKGAQLEFSNASEARSGCKSLDFLIMLGESGIQGGAPPFMLDSPGINHKGAAGHGGNHLVEDFGIERPLTT